MTGPPTPLVSIVVPTYERADHLRSLVDAVLGQVHAPPYEVIVVDDGSEDGTEAVAATIADRRVRFLHQPNRGPGPARNAGAAVAQGDWLVFIDDDDHPDRDWLATLAQGFDPDVGVVSCGDPHVDEDGTVRATLVPEPRDLCEGAAVALVAGPRAIRRSLFERIGGFPPGLVLGENTDLAIRATAAARGAGLRTVLVDGTPLRITVRDRADRASVAPAVVRDAARWLLVRHPTRFAAQPSDQLNPLRLAGVASARVGAWQDARRYLAEATRIGRRPIDAVRWLAAAVPPVGTRAWRTTEHTARHGSRRSIPLAAEDDATTAPADRYFLPCGYVEAPPGGDPPADPWDRTVVARWAAHVARGMVPVLAGVLGQADDPRLVLRDARLRSTGSRAGLVIAEIERDSLAEPATGPPVGDGVRRRWSAEGLALLAESEGFAVRRRRHLRAERSGGRAGPRWTALLLVPHGD